MINLIIRSEEIPDEDITSFYVGTKYDEMILSQLESNIPCLLEGSRGVGKSFLFKVLHQRLLSSYSDKHILPVMVTFRNVSLINANDQGTFQNWMLSRISTEILRSLKKAGAVVAQCSFLHNSKIENEQTELEAICSQFENSWRSKEDIDIGSLPTIDDLLNAVEDICVKNNITRIVINIDEAAHVFIPEQQRQFFTMFRDLRSQYLTCNAAIYPGTTCFGDSFQPMHDARWLRLTRDAQDTEYINSMKEMVTRQIHDSTVLRQFMQYGKNFSLLAYAASGNPRLLFTSIELVDKITSDNTNRIFREFYREKIWAEHTNLAEKFPFCRALIDWGRNFVETIVLPELKSKNDRYLAEGKPATMYFWIHRDAPNMVKESLRLLEYTGIISENATGIRATRNEIGTRYAVNLGCLISLESTPSTTSVDALENMTMKRMSEYGESSSVFSSLREQNLSGVAENSVLVDQLKKDIECLELTDWQKEKLRSVSINTIGELVIASEDMVMQAYYVGNVRARQMKNAAYAAVFEYLLG